MNWTRNGQVFYPHRNILSTNYSLLKSKKMGTAVYDLAAKLIRIYRIWKIQVIVYLSFQ